MHGQHEQQSLLAPAKQLEAVDAFGSAKRLVGSMRRPTGIGRTWSAARRPRQVAADRTRLEELLRFQVEEIEQAALSA